jgi:hypothetical protein
MEQELETYPETKPMPLIRKPGVYPNEDGSVEIVTRSYETAGGTRTKYLRTAEFLSILDYIENEGGSKRVLANLETA